MTTTTTRRQEPHHDSAGRPNSQNHGLTVEWFKQRTGYFMEPEMQRAGEKAEVLHLRAKSYCADAETGGYVPETVLPMLTPSGWRQRVAALVTVGLWDRVQGGYRIVDWDEDQAELEAYAARKRSDAARKRAQRERDRAAADASSDSGQSDDASTDMSRDQSRDGHVSVRTQEIEEEEEKETTSSAAGAADGPKSPNGRTKPDPMARFPEFYAAYPRRVRKGNAEKAWAKAIKGGADPQAVIDGARLHAIACRTKEANFIPHPATWLNGRGWEDEPDRTPAAAAAIGAPSEAARGPENRSVAEVFGHLDALTRGPATQWPPPEPPDGDDDPYADPEF